jgi:hypothetical protein
MSYENAVYQHSERPAMIKPTLSLEQTRSDAKPAAAGIGRKYLSIAGLLLLSSFRFRWRSLNTPRVLRSSASTRRS